MIYKKIFIEIVKKNIKLEYSLKILYYSKKN
jgi:hypothetical protein